MLHPPVPATHVHLHTHIHTHARSLLKYMGLEKSHSYQGSDEGLKEEAWERTRLDKSDSSKNDIKCLRWPGRARPLHHHSVLVTNGVD